MKAAACLKGSPAVAAMTLLLLYYFVLPHLNKYLEVTNCTKNTNTYLSNYPLYTGAIDWKFQRPRLEPGWTAFYYSSRFLRLPAQPCDGDIVIGVLTPPGHATVRMAIRFPPASMMIC